MWDLSSPALPGGFLTTGRPRKSPRGPHILYFFLCCWTFSCFHGLAIVNSASMNITVHASFQIMVSSRYMPRSRFTGFYGSSIFSFFFLETSILFPTMEIVPTYISTNSVGGFPLLLILLGFIVCRFFDNAFLIDVK